MPAVARELSITYAGITVGGASDVYLLTGKHRLEDRYDRASLSFRVAVVGSTEALFAANCAALEAAYRTPRGALVVTLGAQTLKNFSHAANTGYSAVPSISKVGEKLDTGRSREYECSIEVERPADLAGQAGRRDSLFVLQTEPGGRRTCTLSGRYTALAGSAARAQYDAQVAAFEAATLPGGASWRIIDRRAESDDPDKNLGFSHVYEEVLSGGRRESLVSVITEAGGRRLLTISGRYTATVAPVLTAQAAYDAGIAAFIAAAQASILPAAVWQRTREDRNRDELNQNLTFRHEFEEVAIADGDPGPNVTQSVLTISRDQQAPGDSPHEGLAVAAQIVGGLVGGAAGPAAAASLRVQRLATFTCHFSGVVSVRDIAPGVASVPEREYAATIRPWIVRRLQAAHSTGALALIQETAAADPLTGQVQATLIFQGGAPPGGIIEYSLYAEVSDDPGRLIIPVWASSVFAAIVFTGPRKRVRTITERTVSVGGKSVLLPLGSATVDVFSALPAPPGEGLSAGWVSLPRSVRERRLRIGTAADGLTLLERDVVTAQQWVENPGALTG